MNKSSLAALVLLPALLAGCSQVARSVADNGNGRPADVLGLGNVPFTGVVGSADVTPLLRPQAASDTVLSYQNPSVPDFDLSQIPGVVGNPSRVDVDLAFQSAQLTNCGTLPDHFSVTATHLSATASDSVHGSANTDTAINATLNLSRSAPGSDTFTVDYQGAVAAVFGTLMADWGKFGPIFTKGDTPTPNSVSVSVAVHSDSLPVGCALKFLTPQNLQQRVRFL